jgi:hypothetical protein
MIQHLNLTTQRLHHKGQIIFGTLTDKGFIDKETGAQLQVNPKTVAIFTGLVDGKGEKIFTGDILRSYESSFGIGIIRYLKNGSCFVLSGISKGSITNIHLTAPYARKSTIKGNVYQDHAKVKNIIQAIKLEA